jgi:hypothetical protein
MSTIEETYEAWAPRAGAWSPWVKPVLFASGALFPPPVDPNAPVPISNPVPPAPPTAILPRADGTMAVVIDWPGAVGLAYALELAKLGYRPIPLYASAAPISPAVSSVDVWPIIDALKTGAKALRELALKDDAPPAFVLDSNRNKGGAVPGMFDNRTVSFPTDFPSARLLKERGLRTIALVQEKRGQPEPDLSHTLRAFEDGGLHIALAFERELERIKIEKPRWYRVFFYRFLATFGFRRSPLGGFGGILPIPGAG